MNVSVRRVSRNDFRRDDAIVRQLMSAYAIDFWGGTWKELLVVRDEAGRVIEQFGTYDATGAIFQETQELLARTGISPLDADWPKRLWQKAGAGVLLTPQGRLIQPYWSYEQSGWELCQFVTSIEQGGFGGDLLVLMHDEQVIGFTAYTCAPGAVGRALARKRFPSTRFYHPIGSMMPTETTIERILASLYPGNCRLGIFLDHAVAESFRGHGFGSRLFDARIHDLLQQGADVLFGRTMTTAKPQYVGNYLARGLRPIAADGTDELSQSKHYFLATREELIPRRKD